MVHAFTQPSVAGADWQVEVLFGHAALPNTYYRYQHYFLLGLRELGIPVLFRPVTHRAFSWATEHDVPLSKMLWNRFSTLTHGRTSETANHVGRYRFTHRQTGRVVKVAIDCADGRDPRDPEALAWSDLYFKSNTWPCTAYPRKVLPFAIGNGMLNQADLDMLATMRTSGKTSDLMYWSKFWEIPGEPEVSANVIEHQIRLYEALARVRCERRNLLAVLNGNLRHYPMHRLIERLEEAGVPWQSGWSGIESRRFWQSHAQARVVFYRTGNHLCYSWRITGLLAMGACLVFDGSHYPQWYRPLEAGLHYIDGECRLGRNYELPDEQSYARLTGIVSRALADRATISRIAGENVRYFNEYGSPGRLAEYLLDHVRAHAAGRVGTAR